MSGEGPVHGGRRPGVPDAGDAVPPPGRVHRRRGRRRRRPDHGRAGARPAGIRRSRSSERGWSSRARRTPRRRSTTRSAASVSCRDARLSDGRSDGAAGRRVQPLRPELLRDHPPDGGPGALRGGRRRALRRGRQHRAGRQAPHEPGRRVPRLRLERHAADDPEGRRGGPAAPRDGREPDPGRRDGRRRERRVGRRATTSSSSSGGRDHGPATSLPDRAVPRVLDRGSRAPSGDPVLRRVRDAVLPTRTALPDLRHGRAGATPRPPAPRTVTSYTVVHRAPSPDFETPYVVAVVELDEGGRMLTNIVDADTGSSVDGDAGRRRVPRPTRRPGPACLQPIAGRRPDEPEKE